MRVTLSTCAIAWLAACGESGGPAPPAPDAAPGEAACPGARPPLADCYSGDFFSECGGDAAPVFGCKEVGPLGYNDCRWFVGGCAAEGYRVSPCLDGDVCCLADWPFDTSGAPSDVGQRLVNFGTAPWTRARALDVEVVVDPAVSAAPLSITCTGADPLGGTSTPCAGDYGGPFVLFFDTLVVQFPGAGGDGWYPWIEVDLSAPRARVCAVPFDVAFHDTCPHPDRVICATGGTVTLDRLPASEADLSNGLRGRFDVQLPAGFSLSGEFTY